VAIDIRKPERSAWREVIPETKDSLHRVSLVHDTFIASYLRDASSAVLLYDIDGKPLGDVKLQAIGSARGFGGKRTDAVTYYSFTNFSTPGTVYRFDVATRTSTVFRQPRVKADLDAFETSQVFYTSKDGTRVPMFLTYRKGLRPDGRNPTVLYAYGGFDIPETPSFSVSNLVWMEMGGVYALANLRGGGEYGEEWHQAGMFERKQNVFDDFIAAAEWLIAKRYTSRDRLSIYGGSNGGLLVGAALTQRPDLFRAVVCSYPLLDMIRFHKFLVAAYWVPEYGSADDPDQFRHISAYSPYHNVKPGVEYPAVLFITGDADTRVAPLHARKMTALLQASTGSDPAERPILLRYDTKAGHSGGTPVTKQIDDLADEMLFLDWQLGVKY
jgi:prolyl oligopeptidase